MLGARSAEPGGRGLPGEGARSVAVSPPPPTSRSGPVREERRLRVLALSQVRNEEAGRPVGLAAPFSSALRDLSLVKPPGGEPEYRGAARLWGSAAGVCVRGGQLRTDSVL